MIRVFRSEWVKLRRPGVLFGTIGVMSAFVALANFGLFRAAGAFRRTQGPGSGRLLAELAAEGGAVRGLVATVTFLGLVSLVVFASNAGGEYRHGTLRFLLVGQPDRLRLLAGKFLALSSLATVAVAVAVVVSLLTSAWFGSMYDVDGSAWWTGAGLAHTFGTFVNVAVACITWGALGAALAIALRTSTAAIGVGVGYLLVGEAILSRAIVGPVLGTEAAWFPGEVLRAFAGGGGASSSYTRSAVLLLLYGGVTVVAAATLFRRRDVLT